MSRIPATSRRQVVCCGEHLTIFPDTKKPGRIAPAGLLYCACRLVGVA